MSLTGPTDPFTVQDVTDYLNDFRDRETFYQDQLKNLNEGNGDALLRDSLQKAAEGIPGRPGEAIRTILNIVEFTEQDTEWSKKVGNTILRQIIEMHNAASSLRAPPTRPDGTPAPPRKPIAIPDGPYLTPDDFPAVKEAKDALKELEKIWDTLKGLEGDPDALGMCYPDISATSDFINSEVDRINRMFMSGKSWAVPRDPLILDLDGDGVETLGLGAGVYFDHDGDGVLSTSGWVGKDDALLVRDIDGNEKIEGGKELFGDFTRLSGDQLAENGYTALAALDSNSDGLIDASDASFGELKLWQDLNQDGISQAEELRSLSGAGIASLNLSSALKNQRLSSGNTLAREGGFSWSNGDTGAMAEINFAIDTFDTRFAHEIDVPASMKTLPAMQGSGNVRELRQAATQSSALQAVLNQFSTATSRDEQKALLDRLLTKWADTSGMAGSLEDRADGKYRIRYEAFGSESRSNNVVTAGLELAASTSSGSGGGTGGSSVAINIPLSDLDNPLLTDRYRQLIASWSNKLHVLEAFNGQYFFNLPVQKSQTSSANFGLSVIKESTSGSGGSRALESYQRLSTLRIQFSQQQLDFLNEAYAGLKEATYGALVLQTRLKPYLDQLYFIVNEAGISLDASAMSQMLADKFSSSPEIALGDLLDLDRYASRQLLRSNWDGMATFDQMLDGLPRTAGIQALLDEFKVKQLGKL